MGDFYPAFSATCFVVLTLWLMAVVQRYENWHNNRPMIQRAFGIGLFFSLPGIMTLVALVDQVLLCVLLFLGLNTAWFLLFAPSKRAGGARSDTRDPAASTRAAAD